VKPVVTVRPLVIRKPELRALTGLSFSTVRRLELHDAFPRRRLIARGCVGWLAAEVEAWLASRPTVEGRPVPKKKAPLL
jgi:predicted DNA-binding transcriptional regulator AlpA